jgi:hypothetical protein
VEEEKMGKKARKVSGCELSAKRRMRGVDESGGEKIGRMG